MNNRTGRRMFGSIDVDQKSKELLSKLDAYRIAHFGEMIDKFVECFEKYAEKIARMQQAGEKQSVAYINFSVLRTNILSKRHVIRIDAYDHGWYSDRVECSGEYEVGEIYQWLDMFESVLEGARRQSGGHLTLLDVHTLVFEESNHYLLYVTEIIRAGMKKAAETENYRKINRHEVFAVFVGSYQDQSHIVYKEDTTVKDARIIKRFLQAKQQESYVYEFFDGLDLSEGDYENKKIIFCSFSGSDLTGSSFKKSAMVGDNFQNAVLKDTDMGQIEAFDIDFGGAVLENVSFRGAKLNRLSFTGAKLTGVRFEDVSSAENISFEGAELIDTVIPGIR